MNASFQNQAVTPRLVAELHAQFAESAKLEQSIKANLGAWVMAGEWKRTSLREAGVTLIDCDHRTPPAADSGYPYVGIPQFKEGRLAIADARHLSPEQKGSEFSSGLIRANWGLFTGDLNPSMQLDLPTKHGHP